MAISNNSGLTKEQKLNHLNQLAQYRENELWSSPKLHSLFIEMTLACNEHCRHCGSRCGDVAEVDALSGDEIKNFLDEIKKDFDISSLMLCVTGGEPLLRKDFLDIMTYASSIGFSWGMTSNGTLITDEYAAKLKAAGMKTVSISLDGMRKTHDWFRQIPGSFDKTVAGIKSLVNTGFQHVQVTTVVHKRNIKELRSMYKFVKSLGVRSWRVINVEPIGRARDDESLMLKPADYKKMFAFIERYRFKGSMEVTYGCSHFLGLEHERESRKWYFLCNAGVHTASIMYNGDITSCLDIERRPELIQGNIRKDRFKDIWDTKYEIYRSDFRKAGKCANCKDYKYCAGDSFHTWNFDKMEPFICMRDILSPPSV